ncbi:hypothetical protein ACTUSR_09675 [Pantoea stewartii subsp. indologenes]|uniref:hypothetical protein n=1 Tax=Pantoea stewartii TaxID=66269 RepID=UPI003FA4212C
MIVRTWHGCVPQQHAEAFFTHLQKTGVQHAESVPGNTGAFIHQVAQGELQHFFLATYWRDLAAVKAFAGEDYPVAVTYADDEQFGLISDPYVFHHQVSEVVAL